MDFAFAPLSRTLTAWPSAIFGEPRDLLDQIGVSELHSLSDDAGLRFTGKVAWLKEIELQFPVLDGASLAFASNGAFTELPFELQALPAFQLTFPSLDATLRIRSAFLRRVMLQGTEWVPALETDGAAKPLEITLTGVGATVTAEGDVSFQSQPALNLSPFEIGSTGILLSATALRLFLDANAAPPGNAPAGFKGVAIDQANIFLTGSLAGGGTPTVTLTDVLIGASGFSGHVEALWPGNSGQCELFGLPCKLDKLSMDFHQNMPTGGGIEAEVTLPFFKAPVKVMIGYTADGCMTVGLAADATSGLATLHIGSVLDLELDSLKFTVDGGVLTVRLSGLVIPTLADLKCPPIRIDNLTIDSHGNVDLPGGWMTLPAQYGLDFHSFKIEITKFGLGRNDDGTKWIGFSGGIKLVDGLPAGVSVDGLRITTDENWQGADISLGGVGVELEIKDVLYFKGAVAYKNLSGDHRFDGSIRLELKSLKFDIDGQFVAGNTVNYRYMALYVSVDLPTGLPVLNTGLAVFGMAGLFALRMAPNKLPDEKWYGIGDGEGWYKRGQIGVTDLATKWDPRPLGKAFGAGMTFGTFADNGYTVNASALLVGVFPGTIWLLQGAANLLKDRAKLDDEPLFRSLAVLDGQAGSLLIGLDVNYKYDDTGKLITLAAGCEAYYEFADPTAWRINLGLKTPTEQRIQARVFNLFDANAYFMLNANRLAMGAWVGYDKDWKFGPLKVTLEAWMESNVLVSFKPLQFYGDMALHGAVELEAFGYGLGLTVDAAVAAEVFAPKHLLAELEVTLKLPAPLPKKYRSLTAHCRLEFGPDKIAPALPLALKSVSIEHLKVSTTWPLLADDPYNLLSPVYDDGQGFLLAVPSGDIDTLPATIPVVPMDSRPSLHFARNVHDDGLIGLTVQIPNPEREWIGDPEAGEGSALVRYSLQSVLLDRWDGSGWVTVAGRGVGVSAVPELFGTWTPAPAANGTSVAQNRLTLWSKSGFDSFRNTGLDYADWFAGQFGGPAGLPCVPAPEPSMICLDFSKLPLGAVTSPFVHPDHPDVSFSLPPPVVGSTGVTTGSRLTITDPWGMPGAGNALCASGGRIDIHFARPADGVRIQTVGYAPTRALPPDVTAEDAQGATLDPVTTAHGTGSQTRIEVDTARVGPDAVSVVHVSRETGLVCLTEVCATLPPGPQQLAAVAEALARNQAATSVWAGVGDVLEPYTIYRLVIATRIEPDAYPYDPDFNQPRDVVQAAFFQTEGPPGLASLSTPLEPPATDFKSGLENLTCYVRQTVPPTVPAKGQPPLLPRPVYRGYDVGAAFNEDYVDLMYRQAGRDLAVMLYDRNNQPVRGRNGAVAVAENPWGVTDALTLSDQETRWLALIAVNDCVAGIDVTAIPRDRTLTAPAEVLAPDALYQARLVPLLLHEDFGHIAAGTGRWTGHDFPENGGSSNWVVTQTASAPPAWRLDQIAAPTTTPDILGAAAVLGPDPRTFANNPAQWTDYRVAATLQADTGATIGLAFRWLGPDLFYLFAMEHRSGKSRGLYRVANGVPVPLAQDEVLFGHLQPYAVVIEVVGARLKVWVDGLLVFDVVDPTPIVSGSIATHCSGTDKARFSDVTVHDLSPAATSVYGFSFTTSRFVNFAHQVHSHDDDAWPGLCTLDAVDLAGLWGEAVSDIGAPLSDAEARAFETLADDILGPYARQDAPRTETYRLTASGALTGLMLRSPEPLDFSRISIALSHVTDTAPASIAPGPVKLVAAVLGAGQPADESVTLFVRDATDLSGWRLELRDPATTAPTRLDDPGIAWTTIHTFVAGDRAGEAVRLRIHSGAPSSGPAETAWSLERFRAAGDLRLTADSVDLRLVRPDGRVEHARRFFKDGNYAPVAFRLLRKADGTAAVLLPVGGPGAAWPVGALRLAATYRRDNTAAVDDSLVLRQNGDWSDETATLDIPTEPPG